jgi:hypothetical protein
MSVAPEDVHVAAPVLVYIDPGKTPWYDRFFSTWDFDTTDALLAAIASLKLSVDTVAMSNDLARLGLSGWLYWTLYVKGNLQYVDCGQLDGDNVYLDYLVRYARSHNHDPVLAEQIVDRETAQARVELRCRDFWALRRIANEGRTSESAIEPISCYVLREPQIDTKILVQTESGEMIPASSIDGYHRIFAARLFAVSLLPCLVTFESNQKTG